MKRTLLILIIMLASVSGWAQENEFRVPDSFMMKLKENEDGNAAMAEVLCYINIEMLHANIYTTLSGCYVDWNMFPEIYECVESGL